MAWVSGGKKKLSEPEHGWEGPNGALSAYWNGCESNWCFCPDQSNVWRLPLLRGKSEAGNSSQIQSQEHRRAIPADSFENSRGGCTREAAENRQVVQVGGLTMPQ
ncbi:unnamed protein product [Effrenium voratum]|uniref:Uncharacterized protein n=1 Tax=Effrenium voratum TaxID=2562239 RepID=A0AA36JHJ7_9DINO|nr:unnamed protein product [Effrenium voratum]CAJ1405761.1 unnamed protein product [Effrenium voratum]CAJ1450964.1 unnamed protein product [Effrenium voratum]